MKDYGSYSSWSPSAGDSSTQRSPHEKLKTHHAANAGASTTTAATTAASLVMMITSSLVRGADGFVCCHGTPPASASASRRSSHSHSHSSSSNSHGGSGGAISSLAMTSSTQARTSLSLSRPTLSARRPSGSSTSSSTTTTNGGVWGVEGRGAGGKRAGGSLRLQSERAAAATGGVGSGAAGKGGVAGATPSRLGRQPTGGASRTRGDRGKSKELEKLQDKLKRELPQLSFDTAAAAAVLIVRARYWYVHTAYGSVLLLCCCYVPVSFPRYVEDLRAYLVTLSASWCSRRRI